MHIQSWSSVAHLKPLPSYCFVFLMWLFLKHFFSIDTDTAGALEVMVQHACSMYNRIPLFTLAAMFLEIVLT